MKRAALLSALLLAACSADDTATPANRTPSADACSATRAAELPVRLVAGAALVPATINGQSVLLQVDTGAMQTAISTGMAQRLRLSPDLRRRTITHGLGGNAETSNVIVRSVEVGGQEWLNDSITTVPLARTYQTEPPVAGLLGADRLARFDVELDLPRGRMTLWNVHNCTGDFVPWDMPHFAVPLSAHERQQLVMNVEIEGRRVSALIDWGASATELVMDEATQMGITDAALEHDSAGESRDANRNAVSYYLHEFADVRIGAEAFHKIRIRVGRIQLRTARMLLGLDYARTRRIWLSYATRQMFVSPYRTVQASRTAAQPTSPPKAP